MRAYIQQLQLTVSSLAQSLDMANALVNTYFDRSYGARTDEDLAEYNITAGQLANVITLFQQLDKLRNNQAIVAGDYDATLNQVRRDL